MFIYMQISYAFSYPTRPLVSFFYSRNMRPSIPTVHTIVPSSLVIKHTWLFINMAVMLIIITGNDAALGIVYPCLSMASFLALCCLYYCLRPVLIVFIAIIPIVY